MQLRCGRIRRGSDNHDVRSVIAEDVGGTGMYEVQDNTPENARQERRNRPREKKVSWGEHHLRQGNSLEERAFCVGVT